MVTADLDGSVASSSGDDTELISWVSVSSSAELIDEAWSLLWVVGAVLLVLLREARSSASLASSSSRSFIISAGRWESSNPMDRDRFKAKLSMVGMSDETYVWCDRGGVVKDSVMLVLRCYDARGVSCLVWCSALRSLVWC